MSDRMCYHREYQPFCNDCFAAMEAKIESLEKQIAKLENELGDGDWYNKRRELLREDK